ncbi:MAG: maleylacetate reductase [Acidimicrobiales bacterium]
MTSFDYDALAGRVVFGAGRRVELADEVRRMNASRVLLIADPHDHERLDEFREILGALCVASFTDIVQHVPRAKASVATALAREHGIDATVSVGGGSATGFSKAVALELGTPQLCVPTTYAGSELTPIWGLSEGGEKLTGRDLRALPATVIYDPELTLELPVEIAGPSAMNALAHAAEGLYAVGANPVTSILALEAVRVLSVHVPLMCSDPSDLEERSHVLYGAYLASATLAVAGTDLHHRTNHVLGGLFNLDHGQMNAVVLPYALAFNHPAIVEPYARLSEALGADAASAVFDLARGINAPRSLAEIGMSADGIEQAVPLLVAASAKNVRPLNEVQARAFLQACFTGAPPDASLFA